MVIGLTQTSHDLIQYSLEFNSLENVYRKLLSVILQLTC